MSRVRLTFFRPQDDPDEEPSVTSSLNLADRGVKGGLFEPPFDRLAPAPRPPAEEPVEAKPGNEADPDPLAAFASERSDASPDVVPVRRTGVELPPRPALPPRPFLPVGTRQPVWPRSGRFLGLIVLLIVIATAAGVRYFWGDGWTAGPSTSAAGVDAGEGRAMISSNPPGAVVFINDVARGTTPIDLRLPAGPHTVQLQNGAALRTLPLEIVANQITSQYIELPIQEAAPAPSVARPNRSAGAAPQTPARPAAASASAGATPSAATPRQPAAVRAPAAPPTPAPAPAPPPAEGWVTIAAPFPVQVSEGGRTIGSTSAGPLRLSAGLHTLELVNPSLEFSTTLAVNVSAGQTTTAPLTVPVGSLSVNAQPWAEVFVDGRAIGTTPLANIAVPVGSRELLWRHPQLGERRQMVLITAKTPVRIGMDFSR